MKKTSFSAALVLLLAVMMLIVSCGEDPFFHYVSIKYEDKVVKTEIVRDGEEYTLPKEVEGIPEIGGWTIDGKEYDVGDKITVTGDITITAVVRTPVVITLYDDVTKTIYLNKGETELTLPEAPVRTGYDFDGWNVDGATVKAEGKVTYKDGMKIKAIWTRYYTITYNLNEGTGSVAAGKLREDNTEGVKIAAGTGLTKGSLSFSGWNTQADGKGKAYAAGDVYKTKADLTLYAVWVEEVSVTYKDGTRECTVTKKPSEVATWDGTIDSATKWTKEGYVLDGWYSAADGGGTYYTSSSSISNGAVLYAHWVDKNLSFTQYPKAAGYSVKVNDGVKATVTSVTIPSVYHGLSVTEIDSEGFSECGELSSVTIPSSLTKIDRYAFNKCTKLETISLPDTLTTIANSAFEGSGLTSITIPQSVTTLGYSNSGDVFKDCTALATVEIKGSITALESGTFNGCSELKTLTLPDSIVTIGSNCFNGCSKLTSFTFPTSLTTIGASAFSGSGLTSTAAAPFVIPGSVTTIGDYAFYNCSSLVSVEITATNSTTIGNQAFCQCGNLISAKIGSGITAIKVNAFESTGANMEVKIYKTRDEIQALGNGLKWWKTGGKVIEVINNTETDITSTLTYSEPGF